MRFTLQGVSSEAGRDDGIAPGEPRPGKEEETAEEQCDADFGDADRGTASLIDGGNDLEIPLEPDADQTDRREADHCECELLRLDAEEPDERNQEHHKKDGDADRFPRADEAVKDEVGLVGKIAVPDDEELRPHEVGPEHRDRKSVE